MDRRNFIKSLGLFAGALALGAKSKAQAHTPANGVENIDRQIVESFECGIKHGWPLAIDNSILRIDVDGTLYASGEFLTIGSIDAPPAVRWKGNTWSQLDAGVDKT